MNETAYILNTASEKSLVIMDEVGRGTGTNDGLSIAWAVSEELLNRIKCRTFFATHYHELSLLSHSRIVNRSMEVLEKDGGVIFLRKLREGPTAESYGLHVARLAGLPPAVLERAGQIMERLRERDAGLWESASLFKNISPVMQEIVNHDQIGVNNKEVIVNQEKNVVNKNLSDILSELGSLDPDQITPLEAISLVNKWKRQLDGEQKKTFIVDMDTAARSPEIKPRNNKPTDSAPSLFD
jgi:DNA mismatch repair protein MutS